MPVFVSRRRVLAAIAAAGSATALDLTGQLRAADAPAALVDEHDPMAVALGYQADAKRVDGKANPQYRPGASCAGCSWYQGRATDPSAACTFFPGKQVSAHGWCRMWNEKR